MRLKKLFLVLVSLPKTIYFNFRAFEFRQAIHLPFIVSYNTKIGEIHKGTILLNNYRNNYRIKFGIGGSRHIVPNKYSFLSVGKNGRVSFNGKADFAEGCSLRCDYGAISFGKNFSANRNCCFNCEYIMTFGDNNLIGWNVTFRDTDGHQIWRNKIPKATQNSVTVGNHNWICSFSDLLKGTVIGNDCVVGWRTCVNKPFENNNVLIIGNPAVIAQEDIEWEI